VLCWEDLQSVHGFHCYDKNAKCQGVLVLAVCLVCDGDQYCLITRKDHEKTKMVISAPSPPLPPFPQIDIIGAMVIVWSVRGKIISCVLCNIVHNNCVQCNAHTYAVMNRPNSSLDWVLSYWANFIVLRIIFMAALCNRGAIIFLPCDFYLSSIFFFFPRLISAAGDWMSTILPHMVWP